MHEMNARAVMDSPPFRRTVEPLPVRVVDEGPMALMAARLLLDERRAGRIRILGSAPVISAR